MIENIAAYGAETVATVLEFDYVPAPGFLRDRLWDARDNPVQRAVRVRRQDCRPGHVPDLLRSRRRWAGHSRPRSSTAFPCCKLLARAGAHLSGGEKIISATLADPLVASRLGIKVGAPLLETRSMMVDQHNRAVEYIEMLAIPDRLKLRLQVRADQAVTLTTSRPEDNPRRKNASEGVTHVSSCKVPRAAGQPQDDRGAGRHRRPDRRA